jgi:uncharacterized protein (DUF58 family)
MFRWRRRAEPPPLTDAAAAPAGGSTDTSPGQAERLLQQLEWTVLRRLDGQLQGDWRSLFRGSGLQLADLREYQPHDDVRHIDWNVTARLQTPHVRQYLEDREISAWFVVDRSASLGFGSGSRSKHQLAAQVVGTLARLLAGRGNRVGALCVAQAGASRPWVLPARNGRRHVLHLLQHLLQAPPAGGPGSTTDLAPLLLQAQALIRRRAQVFLVSDFISPPGWAHALQALAQRHEVIAIRLFDPLEMALPESGLLPLQDAETGEVLLVDTHDRGFRARFAEQAQRREQTLRQHLAEAGVDTLELSVAQPLDQALLRFVRLRQQAQRQGHSGQGQAAPSPASSAFPRPTDGPDQPDRAGHA